MAHDKPFQFEELLQIVAEYCGPPSTPSGRRRHIGRPRH